MFDNSRKPCRRCLLEQAGDANLARAVKERIALIPEEKKAPAQVYARRLEICRSCECLISGTCIKCGCYAELRAARADSGCPHEKKFWKPVGLTQTEV